MMPIEVFGVSTISGEDRGLCGGRYIGVGRRYVLGARGCSGNKLNHSRIFIFVGLMLMLFFSSYFPYKYISEVFQKFNRPFV
jgi:hypothetical protein